ARRLAEAWDLPEPPVFDPVRAVRTPALRRLFRRIGEELLDVPPADAPLVTVGVRSKSPEGDEREAEFTRGWLLSEKDEQLVVLVDGAVQVTIDLRRRTDGFWQFSY